MRRGAGVARSCQRAIAAGLTLLLLTGCANGLASLPLPAPGVRGDSISLTAAFSNALNLPTHAKVKLNGADIGEVESIRAQNFTAYVTLEISADVSLYAGTTAELRSATPLGDVFVALRPAPNQADNASRLRDGDTLALNSTTAAATVEEVLGSAALLVNGGAIRHLVTVLNGAGSAVGGRGEKIAGLLRQSNTLISRLNARSAQIDTALRATSDLAALMVQRQNVLNETIAAAVPATDALRDNSAQLADVITAVARITSQLNRFPSLQGTDTRSMIADLNHLSTVFNDISVDPNVSLTEMNELIGKMIKYTGGPAVIANGDVKQLAFGALPDMNYPGDPGFHGADGTDWHAMIASLRYEWNLLLSKVYGPEHRPR